MLQKYLLCAKAVSTHGIRGTLRLENHADSTEVLCGLKKMYIKTADGMKPLNVVKASPQKNMVLAAFAEVGSIEEAVKYKGCELYADRDDFDLPEDSHFIADIEGLPVIDLESGETIGKVKEILTGRSQDIYVIDDRNGGEFMVPGVDEFIKRVCVEGRDAGVYVTLIDGMRQHGGDNK